jgi:hypothetical protein
MKLKTDRFDNLIYRGVSLELKPENIFNHINCGETDIKKILEDAYISVIDEIRSAKISNILSVTHN